MIMSSGSSDARPDRVSHGRTPLSSLPNASHDRGGDDPDDSRARAMSVLRGEFEVGRHVLRRHGWRLLLLFGGVLLPLWTFAELADEVREAQSFAFDAPILRFAQAIAGDSLNRWFLFFSELGYAYGVVPVDIVLIVALALLRRYRESIFALVAVVGSALLNLAAKQFFARERPSLWESIAPETTYSFPSGHAMGSMTLAMVLVL